jgi:hypothetical protein
MTEEASPIEVPEEKDSLQTRLNQQITKLVNYRGPAKLNIVDDGELSVEDVTIIRGDERSRYIECENCKGSLLLLGSGSIPILGTGIAIQKATGQNGNVIYENPAVDESYCLDTSNDVRIRCGFDSTLK